MAGERFKSLLAAVYKKTEAKEISWQTTPDANTFRLVMPSGSIRVSEEEVPSSDYYESCFKHTAYLDNTEGVLVTYLSGTFGGEDDFEDARGVSDLFQIARESALKLEDTVADMLQDLEQGKVIKDK